MLVFLFGGPIFGYREIDLQASKNWDLTNGMNLQFRLDVLNAFNFKNYAVAWRSRRTSEDVSQRLPPIACTSE